MAQLPSLVLVAGARSQRSLPFVPELRARSEFDSQEAFDQHRKERRKAQERLREFNRPKRVRQRGASGSVKRTAAASSLADAIQKVRTRERRILWHANVETGRKRLPEDPRSDPRSMPMEPAARHAVHQADERRLPKATSAKKMQQVLQQQEEWRNVTLSQVRRSLTAVRKADDPDLIEYDRTWRRHIQKRVSDTRPAVYSARLASQREARRPQMEARAAVRAQKQLQRDQDVAIAKWELQICQEEEQAAQRTYGVDKLISWYLAERRRDAESALSVACGKSRVPRWKHSEAATGPWPYAVKYSGMLCDCGRPVERCKCQGTDCVICERSVRRCKCPWFEYTAALREQHV